MIRQGDKICIGKERYEVLTSTTDIDYWDSKAEKIIGNHTQMELHKIGDESLLPTHLLKIYDDKKEEAILLRIEQEKPNPSIKNPMQRGQTFSYHEEKRIKTKDIKIN